MNKYPAWLNVLVLVILLTGILLALPNLYGSVPAIQLADRLGEPVTETQIIEGNTQTEFGLPPTAEEPEPELDGPSTHTDLAPEGVDLLKALSRNADETHTKLDDPTQTNLFEDDPETLAAGGQIGVGDIVAVTFVSHLQRLVEFFAGHFSGCVCCFFGDF